MKEKILSYIKSLDLKSWLIIILFILCGLIFTKFMISGKSHRKINNQLKKENVQLKKERKKLEKDYLILEKNIKKDSIKLEKLEKEYLVINKLLYDKEQYIKKSQYQVDSLRKEILKYKMEIDSLENNPPNRRGEDLLRSIKEKTKK